MVKFDSTERKKESRNQSKKTPIIYQMHKTTVKNPEEKHNKNTPDSGTIEFQS
jgi:hypothetical protein